MPTMAVEKHILFLYFVVRFSMVSFFFFKTLSRHSECIAAIQSLLVLWLFFFFSLVQWLPPLDFPLQLSLSGFDVDELSEWMIRIRVCKPLKFSILNLFQVHLFPGSSTFLQSFTLNVPEGLNPSNWRYISDKTKTALFHFIETHSALSDVSSSDDDDAVCPF